jgi:homoserine dehydrogenase
MEPALGVALLGAGTVGAAVVRELDRRRDRLARRSGGPVELRCVAERDPGRRARLQVGGAAVVDDVSAALGHPGVDLVVELMGGLEPAGAALEAALGAGLGVVTANKALIATRGHELARLVRPGSGGLAFEAAVGAAIPVLAALRDSLAGDEVGAVTAVINGTTNHVLGRLEAGDDLAAAVRDAQRRGYTEADPSADLDGHDAAQKLCILAWFAMHARVSPDQVERRGIRGISADDAAAAGAMGQSIRLVARAERTPEGLSLSVQPTCVLRSHALGRLEGPDNAVIIESDLAGTLQLHGPGAGADAAASAVLGDIAAVALARRRGTEMPLPPAAAVPVLGAEEAETAAWLRLHLGGDPEAPAVVTQMLEDRGVDVEGVTRVGAGPEWVVLTRPAPRALLARAVDTLDTVAVVEAVDQVLDRLEAGR